MPEISRKVVPYEYAYICDGCKTGMLQATGEKTTDALFCHKCMICGNTSNMKKVYPHIEYYGEGEKPGH